MPIIAGQAWVGDDPAERDRERSRERERQADSPFAPAVDRFLAERESETFRRPRQAAVAAETLGDVRAAAPIANRNGWPVDVVASDPARFTAEDRRRRLDAVTDPATASYLSDPRRNALVGDDIEATNTLGASVRRALRQDDRPWYSAGPIGYLNDFAASVLSSAGLIREQQPSAGGDLWLSVKQASRRTTAAVTQLPQTVIDAGRSISPLHAAAIDNELGNLGTIISALGVSPDEIKDAVSGTQTELAITNRQEYQREASPEKVARDSERPDTFWGTLAHYVKNPQAAAEDLAGSVTAMGLGGAGMGGLTIPLLAGTQASDAQLQIKADLRMAHPDWPQSEIDARAAEVALPLIATGLIAPRLSHGAGVIERVAAGNLRRTLEPAARSTAIDFGRRAAFSRFAGNVGGELISEPLEEGTIQALQNVATGAPVMQGVGGAAASGAVLAGVMGAPAAGYEEHVLRTEDARRRAVVDELARVVGSANDSARLVALTQAAVTAKLTEVDPAEAAAFVREHMGDAGGTVYVPVSEVAALYQDDAEQRAAFEALTDDHQAVMDAGATGDIAVPLDRWVSQVARLPKADELARVSRMTPDGMSGKEVEAFSREQIQADIERYYAETAEETERASGPEGEVFDRYYGEFLPHYGEDVAGRLAATMQAFYRTMGAKIGVDALTLANRFRVNIDGQRRGNLGVAPRNVDIDIDPLIDAALTGNTFTDDEVHGNAPGIISMIVAAGGIRPDSVGADDLRSLGNLPVGFFNVKGRTAENMAETLADDGWRGSFTDVDSYGRPGSNELTELVERELFGEKVFPDMDSADQDRAAKREVLNNDIATVREAFKRYEAETSIDPATLPREQQREIALGGLNALEQSGTEDEVEALVREFANVDGAPTEAEIRKAIEQFRETERAYGGRAAYDKAKAAGKTKLTYGQWVQVRTPAFLEWFGDWMNDPANASKVVDPETGEPMVGYHGTNQSFDSFDEARNGQNTSAVSSIAFFFTEDAREADEYAELAGRTQVADAVNVERKTKEYEKKIAAAERRRDWDEYERLTLEMEEMVYGGINADPSGQAIVPVYLAIKNPLVLDMRDSFDAYEVREAIERAKNEGHDGLKLTNVYDPVGLGSRELSGLDTTTQWVAFRPEQIKSATANIGTFSERDNILYQPGSGKPRGQIVGRGGESIIGQSPVDGVREFNVSLLARKNVSTALHELGHAFLEIFADLAQDANASESLKADWASTLDFLGVKERGEIGREQHEKFARGFEQYNRDGKAPSSALRRAFILFGTFLTRIYKMASALRVDLTPEFRGVLDRMLASEEEIAEAQSQQSLGPLLDGFDGFSAEERLAYARAVLEARGDAERRLAAEVLRAQQRAEKAWQSAERKKVQAEVEASVREMPEYRAIRWLRSGKMPNGEPVEVALKLSKQDLLDRFGKAILPMLRGMYSAEGGTSADAVAAALGFVSGHELVNALANARPMQAVIKAETDNIMTERYPDPMNDGSMAERAQKKVHSSKQREMMLLEINALERRAGKPPTQMAIMREAVRRILGDRVAYKIQPSVYRAAEAKAGREAFNAIAKGDHAGALEARQRQMLNSMLYSEAARLRNDIAKAQKLFKRYTSRKTRAKIGKVGGSYLEQIDGLLERFDFRNVSGAASQRRASLRDWIARMQASGVPVDLPDRLLDDAYRIPFKNMTVSQMMELRDAVVQIAHLASLKGKLLLNGELRDRKAIDEEIGASVMDGGKAEPDVPGVHERSLVDRLAAEAQATMAGATHLVRRMDGMKELGPMFMNTVQVIRDAMSRDLHPQLQKMREAVAKLYLSNYTRKELAGMSTLRKVDGVAGVWSRESILAVALNWGNEGNRAALLSQSTRRLTEADVSKLFGELTAKDWDFVEGVWEHVNSYWDEIAKAQRRRKGLVPEKVQATPFVVALKDGGYREVSGGYYPLKYSGGKAEADEVEDFFKDVTAGKYVTAQTRAGYAKERVGSGGRVVRLDLGVLDQHLEGLLQDLYLGDAVNYVSKVLKGSRLNKAAEATNRNEMMRALDSWLKDVAIGDASMRSASESIARALRQNFTAAVLGYKATTAIMQTTGLVTAMPVIGYGNVIAGLSKYVTKPAKWTKYVRNASPYMDRRVGTTVDTVLALSDARSGVYKRIKSVMVRNAYVMIGFVQQIVDTVSWLAAERSGLEMFDGDAAKARAYADDLVSRSQGSQAWEDLNAIQRGTFADKARQVEWIKAVTTLQGYLIAKHNMIIDQSIKAARDIDGFNVKSIGVGMKYTADMLVFLLADGVLTAAIRGSLPDDDDDDDWFAAWGKFLASEAASSSFGAVPGVGSIIAKAHGYDVDGATTRLWGDVVRAGEQAWQGEYDDALRRSVITLGGDATGLPSSQINATLDAISANQDGRDVSAFDYIRGVPRKDRK